MTREQHAAELANAKLHTHEAWEEYRKAVEERDAFKRQLTTSKGHLTRARRKIRELEKQIEGLKTHE